MSQMSFYPPLVKFNQTVSEFKQGSWANADVKAELLTAGLGSTKLEMAQTFPAC